MEVVRNVQLTLDVPEDAHSVLDETFEQSQQAARHVAEAGWSDDPTEIEDSKNTLHDQIYTEVREQTSLQASLVQSARNFAAGALSNCKDRISTTARRQASPSSEVQLSCTTGAPSRTTTPTLHVATVQSRRVRTHPRAQP